MVRQHDMVVCTVIKLVGLKKFTLVSFGRAKLHIISQIYDGKAFEVVDLFRVSSWKSMVTGMYRLFIFRD
jgi:hypothetical protein